MDELGTSRITDYLLHKGSYLKIPMSGTFELTPMCNFDCKMCYVRKSAKEVKEHLRPMMTLEKWLEIAKAARDKGMLFLLLTGGEPLSWPYFWDLYIALVKMGLVISINSNGSLINEKSIEIFKKYPPRRINITLYGANDDTYYRLCGIKNMYSRVVNNIEELQKAKIPVKLNCSLTPLNVNDLEDIVEFSKSHDLILEFASYMFPPVRKGEKNVGGNAVRFTSEEYARNRILTFKLQNDPDKYENYLRNILKGYIPPAGLDEYCEDPLDGKVKCRAGSSCFWITWDGLMTPCGMMFKPTVDLYKYDFENCWNQIVNSTENIKLSGICSKCKKRELCHSCAAMALAETGEFEKVPKYLCEMVEAMKNIAQKELESL